jgi:hypothetical protein
MADEKRHIRTFNSFYGVLIMHFCAAVA